MDDQLARSFASVVRRRLLAALALCAAIFATSPALAAPLKVSGRFLQDAHGNNLMLRGLNVPVYKSGFLDDLDAVAAAVALTQANAVRLEWWAVPPGGTTEYTAANLDRAIQKFFDLGIVPIVDLHDLTFKSDPAVFAATITPFWTDPAIVAILVKHQDHVVVNVANEWGDPSDPATFLSTYGTAIAAIRNAGIVAPLMIDAPQAIHYEFFLAHGADILALDPMHSMLLSVHAYWAASDPNFSDANVLAILDSLQASGLPIVIGEASSNAVTNNPCDLVHYANLLTRANANSIGYLFWAWYEDGNGCPVSMNITVNQDGVTLPTAATPGFGNDALNDPGFGIDAAQPPTVKADFSPVVPPPPDPPRLANISTRMDVLTGNNVMIAGFIIGGSTPKTVAITAAGPSLVPFGISNPLPNPTLTLVRQSDHVVLATNDDWQTDPDASRLLASGFAPTDPHEAGLVVTLPPGAYTAIVSGSGGGVGVSLVGVFELDHPEIPLINISTRGFVQGGNNVMIAGLIVEGTGPQKVVITAAGPSLVPFGITNPLANPSLTLVRQSDHVVIATNDDWQTNANAADIMATGFAPTDPHESALLVALDPGAYTAIVSGVGGGVGVSLVGVFTVP